MAVSPLLLLNNFKHYPNLTLPDASHTAPDIVNQFYIECPLNGIHATPSPTSLKLRVTGLSGIDATLPRMGGMDLLLTFLEIWA